MAAVVALDTGELEVAVPVLHLAGCWCGHAVEVNTVVAVAECAADWPFWFSSAFGSIVTKEFTGFTQQCY